MNWLKKYGGWIGGTLGVILWLKFVDRYRLIEVINQSLPVGEAGMLAAMLWGESAGISREMFDYLRVSGLIHLMIVSGSNVMLLVGGLIEYFSRFWGRKRTIGWGLVVGWWYVGIVNWQIPVIRAMLMVSIFYWAQLMGKKFNPFRALMVVGIIFILAEVKVLSSVSFWLSIMAFAGVLTSSKIINQTIWVGVWITPILGLVFGKISLISPITNMVVVGMVEMITALGLIANVAGVVWPWLGKVGLWLVLPLIKILEIVVRWGGNDVFEMKVSFNWWMLVGWYMLLAVYLIYRWKKEEG